MSDDLRQVHPEALLAFLRARLEEEFADATETSLLNLARQYSTHPDYLDEWPSAVPGEPRQRFAETLNDTVRPVMLIGLDELGEERANNWATWTIKAVMAVRDEELERVREERDLAIAHDRQPYPTAWAYEQACSALESHRERADAAEAKVLGYESAISYGTDSVREAELLDECRSQEERAEKAEAANTLTRERLDALIAAGFGATTDTLREVLAALDYQETDHG